MFFCIFFFGFQVEDEELESALDKALEVGYRHIDTAAAYYNEHVIGKVLNKWITSGRVKREDLFITTKVQEGFCLTVFPVVITSSNLMWMFLNEVYSFL